MRQKFMIVFCLLSWHLKAQDNAYFKDVVLKTNVLSPVSLGIEFPIKDNISFEYAFRRGGTFIFSKNTYRDERLNLKYHMPINAIFDKRKSFYLMLGIHHEYRELDNVIHRSGEREYGRVDQNKLVCGVGVRYKYLDFWVAAESVFFERSNYYERYGSDGRIVATDYWKKGGGLSLGLSINFLNISKLRWR